MEPIEESDLNLESKLKKEDVGGLGFDGKKEEVFKVEKEAPLEKSGAEKDDAYGKILSKLGDDTQSDDGLDESVLDDVQSAIQKTDAESQISHLVDIAMLKGVVHAVKVARHLEDNYVLDAFHDRLMAEELHDALVEKGLLKNV